MMTKKIIDQVLLVTPRLRLRRLEMTDQPLIEALFCDAEMMRYVGGVWTRQAAAETTIEWHEHWGIDNYFYGVLEINHGGVGVGIAGFTENTHVHEKGIEFSWFILPGHQGRGYATEVTKGIMTCVFERMHKKRLFAETHPDNPASNRVLEKMGFTELVETNREDESLPGFNRQIVWEYLRRNWLDHALI